MPPLTPFRYALVHPVGPLWFAWDEVGRPIGYRPRCGDIALLCASLGYAIVDHDSPLARTIRERMRFRYANVIQQQEQHD